MSYQKNGNSGKSFRIRWLGQFWVKSQHSLGRVDIWWEVIIFQLVTKNGDLKKSFLSDG